MKVWDSQSDGWHGKSVQPDHNISDLLGSHMQS